MKYATLLYTDDEVDKIMQVAEVLGIYPPFLLYIKDLPFTSNIVTFYLFADDTNLFYSNTSIDQLEEIVNCVLLNISDWLTANKLALNTSKSNFMIIKPRQRKLSKNVKLKIDNEILQESKCVKYLGVLISKNQTWKEYIQF